MFEASIAALTKQQQLDKHDLLGICNGRNLPYYYHFGEHDLRSSRLSSTMHFK